MLNLRTCLVSLCCRHRSRKSARIVHDHPCNVFLPAAVARDHAIEMAFAAAEAAQVSAASAQRAVNQLVELKSVATVVFQQAAKKATELEKPCLRAVPEHQQFGGFTVLEMSRVSRELVRSNSA